MKKFLLILCPFLLAGSLFVSCNKDPFVFTPSVLGCMDPNSLNYDATATLDNNTCIYPDKFMPMAVGNEWHLSDQVTFLTQQVNINADFTMFGDTTIDGIHYYQMHEVINTDLFGEIQNANFLYRQITSGKVLRTAIGDSIETIFLTYPLDLGVEWYDRPDQTGYFCQVFNKSLITVPVGTFNDCAGIHFTNLSDSSVQDLYFAKDAGLIRVDINYDVLGTPISAQLELDTYILN